jgi:hypothetical protein
MTEDRFNLTRCGLTRLKQNTVLGKWLTTRTTTLLGHGKCIFGLRLIVAVDLTRGTKHTRVNEGEQNEIIS